MKSKEKKLTQYQKKRDFLQSPEPAGTTPSTTTTHKKPIFVIQYHQARSLHYDVRLEIDGVLVSWAVPKGPSCNPKQRRLAVKTEDHPLKYATFEGVIPEGNYGAGTVMVWDYGNFTNIKKKDGVLVPLSTCLQQGTIEVILEGKKLQGAYALIKMYRENEKQEQWLLIKMHDEHASSTFDPVKTMQYSALTNKTITQIINNAYKNKS